MSEINILSPHVADLIAAGEVVERPASVVKELMENAFDAGARAVTVEFKDGGATYIRVADDGRGMAPEDAGIAFLRHATSKLHDEAGLEAIGTMGFRGEALAAISAVSEVELITRRRGDESGTYMTLEAGDIREMRETGCPEGTTMIVRDGREEFFSPGDGRPESAVYALLGRDFAKDLLPCASEDGDLKLHGFVSSPSAGRGNRGAQFFFCNGRYIRSQLLQTALEQAYKNTLLVGRFPACVLYLEPSCAAVDVNVHPAKTEVKFSQEKRVFDLVYHAALSALQSEDRGGLTPAPARAPAQTPAPPAARPEPRADFYRSMSSADFRAQGYRVSDPGGARRPSETVGLKSYDEPYQTRLDLAPASFVAPIPPISTEKSEKADNSQPKSVEISVLNAENNTIPD